MNDEHNIKEGITFFISKTTMMVNKREKNLLYNFYFRQTAIIFLYFFNFTPFLLLFSSFFPTFFVLILSYLSGTCTFVFTDISGRNFLSSFRHFWAELLSQVGGGCTCTQCTPPAYAPDKRLLEIHGSNSTSTTEKSKKRTNNTNR